MSDLRSQLQALYEEHGKLTPGIVVADGKSPTSPFHPRLEWNDRIAGHEYRILQADKLIRSVHIERIEGDNKAPGVREWVAIRGDNSYEPAVEVVKDEFSYALWLRSMEREFAAVKSRYSHSKEWGDLMRREAASAAS